MISGVRHVLDIADLTDDHLDLALGDWSPPPVAPATTVGLLFLASSLRTRLGFATAAVRLGATPLFVDDLRSGAAMTSAESVRDTVRTVAGMVNCVVVRSAEPLDRDHMRAMPVPVVNGGDPGGEHPTQALIDLAATERFAGPIAGLRLGVCGDLTMRATTSLLRLLSRRPPGQLTLIAPPSRSVHGVPLPFPVEHRDHADFGDLDVVLMTGLAPAGDRALDENARARFALNARSAATLRDDAVVLSPMPVIDEIDDGLRWTDPRVRIYDQSDLGVIVRQRVLGMVLGAL